MQKMKSSNITKRSEEEKSYLTKRLNIIEGQVRGIKEMINNERHCSDILIQMNAISKGLESLGEEIIKTHLYTSLADYNIDNLDEIMDLYKKLYK